MLRHYIIGASDIIGLYAEHWTDIRLNAADIPDELWDITRRQRPRQIKLLTILLKWSLDKVDRRYWLFAKT